MISMTKEAGNSRTVRVFLSSTFRDFMEERDLLVRKVFPELRRRCRQRQVELIEVDLRWGITEQEAQQGKVLPICLTEIDRARPFFMGLLGDRYGWVPEKNQYDLSMIVEQPWLEEHRGGKSVTELEILHGVLNNPKMAGRAFFYFRSPAFSRKKGGPYLSEGTDEKAKLEALKDRIRKSMFPVVENYRSPEILAERVRADLWKLIEDSFPESEVPDALARERMRHEAYSSTRRRLYLGGKRYFETLDAAMVVKPARPVLLNGHSGVGKSALLANWVAKWTKQHPKALVIVHHLGCGADAADPVRMATRLMEEIARTTGVEFKPESDPDKQLDQLPDWLAIASTWARSTRKEFLFVLDGLDKISDRKHLGWLPRYLPPRIKLVASCLEGEILEAAKGRLAWRDLRVRPLTRSEQKQFIGKYLGRYRKSLTTKQTNILQGHPLSGNPLFLLTVLEELRVFGVHEKLEGRLLALLSPPPGKTRGEEPTVDDVFEHVLSRIEKDLGRKSVQSAMEAIWASRSGLLQDELLGISKLAPSRWAAIQNALDESISESGGKINFGHDHLRRAVEDRYGLKGKSKLAIHRRLAKWFDYAACEVGVDTRIAEELPWQLDKGERKQDLTVALTDRALFEMLYINHRYELVRYWLKIKRAPLTFYQTAWREWERDEKNSFELKNSAFMLAEFLRENGSVSKFVGELYQKAKSYLRKTKQSQSKEHYKDQGFLAIENSEGLYYLSQSEYLKAEAIFRKGVEKLTPAIGRYHPDTLDAINNLAQSLWRQGKNDEAEPLYREVLEERSKLFGENHPRTISSLIGAGNVAAALKKANVAKDLMIKALQASRDVYGDSAEMTFGVTMNLANLLRDTGLYKAAHPHYEFAERGFRELVGKDHPLTLSCRTNHAMSLSHSGETKKAKHLLADVLARRNKVLGGRHPAVFSSRNNLGSVFELCGDVRAAKTHYKLALAGRIRNQGPAHPDTIQSVKVLGNLMHKMGDHSGMEKLFSDYLKRMDSVLPKDHTLVLETASYLAFLKNRHGKRRQALALLRKRAAFSATTNDALRYNIACYECLTGNSREAKKLIAKHLNNHPEQRNQALADPDFTTIRDYIETL